MRKNYFFKFSLLLIPTIAFVLMSSNTGQDGALSGSPADGATCSQCHSGGNFGASINITTDIPITGYLLNTPYNITVTMSSSGASRHGFALTAEKDSDNAKVGALTAGTGTRLVNGGANITQSNPNNNTWNFTWTSPSTDEGSVSFYAAGNAANGNGNISGDQIVTTSLSQSSLSISQARLLSFKMYPNPTVDEINIQLPTGTSKANASVFDYTGRLIKSQEVSSANSKVDVRTLSRGMYIIRVTTDSKIGAQQFIKS